MGDLGVIEVSSTGEGAAEKDRSVDRRYFAVDEGLAGFDVVEVVEEAVLVRHGVEMEFEGGEYLFFCLDG